MIKVKYLCQEWLKNCIEEIIRDYCKIEAIEDDNPDYMFYDPFSDYQIYEYDCIKIFFSGENIYPDFNICDYAVGFHKFELDDRYLQLPLLFFYTKDFELAAKKHLDVKEALYERNFCNFIYSNGKTALKEREEFFDLLSKYKRVDSGGRYRNNLKI